MLWGKNPKSRLMFWSLELLILASLIFISSRIQFIFKPIVTFFQTLFIPVLIALFLYYILNPLVNLLERMKIKRIFGIIIVFLLLIGTFAFVVMQVIPSLMTQLVQFAKMIPKGINMVTDLAINLSHEKWVHDFNIDYYLQKFDVSAAKMIKSTLASLTTGMGSVISSITSILVTMITAPIMLFYMLKDGHKVIPSIQKYLPDRMQDATAELLQKMSQTLSSYISGQALECLFVAVLTFIGYRLVGIPYAFLFAVIAGGTNMIPYLGPYLGLAPALITSLFISPLKAILCAIVVLVVQQIDSNIVYPSIIGKSLDIHPMTIIVILLVAGNLAGVFGMFLGVPIYAIAKTIFVYLYELYQVHKETRKLEMVKNEQSIRK